MASTGDLQIRAYTSSAQLPLEDVAIAITALDGSAIALDLTDDSGKSRVIPIPVPDPAESQEPDQGTVPFTAVNIYAHIGGFELVEAEHVQIFPGVLTVQDLEMVPLPELPGQFDKTILYDTPPQNL